LSGHFSGYHEWAAVEKYAEAIPNVPTPCAVGRRNPKEVSLQSMFMPAVLGARMAQAQLLFGDDNDEDVALMREHHGITIGLVVAHDPFRRRLRHGVLAVDHREVPFADH
jgi:hypothetical protein